MICLRHHSFCERSLPCRLWVIINPRQLFVAFGMHFLCTLILQSNTNGGTVYYGHEQAVMVTFATVSLFDETFEKTPTDIAFGGRSVAVHVETMR